MNELKVFSIITGNSQVEFSVWQVNGGWESRVNNVRYFKSHDYLAVRDSVTDSMDANTFAYIGGMTH